MEYGIGNTADFGVSELDEGQAAGLLAAVGGHGLSLVEPGPATDPVEAGLKASIARARLAWERTQPQLVIDGWLDMLDGLDEAQSSALRLVEPTRLTSGAEPSYAPPEGLAASTSRCVAPSRPAPPNRGGSAPSQNTTGSAADPVLGSRGAPQKGA